MAFQDVEFPLVLHHISWKIVVEVNASGPPHVLGLWMGAGKDMLPVKYFFSNKASFLCHGGHMAVTEMSKSSHPPFVLGILPH